VIRPRKTRPKKLLNPAVEEFFISVRKRGLEQDADSSQEATFSEQGAAKCAACGDTPLTDADLRSVIDAWPDLPEAIRVGILSMVRSAAE
jgi:hypothetical protein